MPNQLADETSPYLLQHANNPVDWRPWGPPALKAAKDSGKPIFLSIGYSACHWCHVMEHESFEDETTADYLNKHYVSIKVDREERPDLDHIYMSAVQLITGQGGWPLSAFLTPDLEPFYGGTYWPPQQMFNRPSFMQVLHAVMDAWTNRKEQAIEQAKELSDHLRRLGGGEKGSMAEGLGSSGLSSSDRSSSKALSELALARLGESFDSLHGGFGEATKFPHPMDIRLLVIHGVRNERADATKLLKMSTVTLDKMAAGGIYDHAGGGFARYSVDAQWLVPHFEKMLYDNSLLTSAYLDAYLVTGREDYRRVIDETLTYVLRDMTDSDGGFHSSEDADSEGVEGKFYVWSTDELNEVLGEETGQRLAYVYNAIPHGNFEGKNILHLARPLEESAELKGWDPGLLREEMRAALDQLMAARNHRVRPGKDDKILASWNALMIEAMARSGAALQAPEYVEGAVRAATFIRERMCSADGRLLHCWRLGKGREMAFLEDYAGMVWALPALYEATWDEHWIDWAAQLAEQMIARFYDPDGGGFFFTANDHETLIARNKDVHDASVPSGNALAATGLLRLGMLCGRSDWIEAAQSTLEMAADSMQRSPMTGQLFIALDLFESVTHEVIVVSSEEAADEVSAALRSNFAPHRVVALRVEGDTSFQSKHLQAAFAGKTNEGEVTMYVCQDHVCGEPKRGLESCLAALHHHQTSE